MEGFSSRVPSFFKKGARAGEQSKIESQELAPNRKTEQDTYDALRTAVVPIPIPGGRRSRTVETRHHPGSDSPAGKEADKGSSAEQEEVVGLMKSEQHPDTPPTIVVEDYETKRDPEVEESVQKETTPNRRLEGETTDDGEVWKPRQRSRSLLDMKSFLEMEERVLAQKQGGYAEVISSFREFKMEGHSSGKMLSVLPTDKTLSGMLKEHIKDVKLHKQSVEDLRNTISAGPGGEQFITAYDYARGLTPQSKTPKNSLERLREQKRKSMEAKSAEALGASHSGNEGRGDDLQFDKITPGGSGLNERGKGGLSRAREEAAARESQKLKAYPGLEKFRPGGRRSRSVSDGASPRMRPQVQLESWQKPKIDDNDQPEQKNDDNDQPEQKNDDNDQPWLSEDRLW